MCAAVPAESRYVMEQVHGTEAGRCGSSLCRAVVADAAVRLRRAAYAW
ncbi:hypothetical protein ACFOPS_08250 [Ralstonia solanacearum]